MGSSDFWQPVSWHCPNCGTLTRAFRNSEGLVKAVCPNERCNVVMVRKDMGRRHSVIDVYASKRKI